MTLNAEERRAVDFAMKHWLSRRACDVERSRLYLEVVRRVRAQRYGQESAEAAADYAIGAMDGFRAGVEAAIEAVRDCAYSPGEAMDLIRALLAQEDKHGS